MRTSGDDKIGIVRNRNLDVYLKKTFPTHDSTVLDFSNFDVRPDGRTFPLISVLKQSTRPTVGSTIMDLLFCRVQGVHGHWGRTRENHVVH